MCDLFVALRFVVCVVGSLPVVCEWGGDVYLDDCG